MIKNFITLAVTLSLCWIGANYYLYHITALDGRSRVHALQDEWHVTPDIAPNISPKTYALNTVHPSFVGALPKEIAFPLGGPPNTRTLYCEEDEGWHIEKNDRYGFFNPDTAWDKPIDIALMGDSFAQGACTNQHIRYWYDLFSSNNIVSLGMGGNGSLIEYAGFRELLSSKHIPKRIFWLIVANDITDMSAELNSPILNKYLTDNSFSQRYFDIDLSQYSQNILDSVPKYLERNARNIKSSLLKSNASIAPKIVSGHYIKKRLKKYKKFLGWKELSKTTEVKTEVEKEEIHLAKRNNLQKMKIIFNKASTEATSASIDLSFIFIPSASHCYNDSYPAHFNELEDFFLEKGITYFRGHKILKNNSCTDLFATKRGGHLNSNGYKKIAELLLKVES